MTTKTTAAAAFEPLPAWFHEALVTSALLPRDKRFASFAAALSPDALKTVLEGAEAVRLGLRDSPEAELARAVAVRLWALIHGEAARNSVTEARIAAWTCSVGIALMLEHLRRLHVVHNVPGDPFSRWAIRWALRQLSL